MPSIDFYALRMDICELVHFIFEETDARVFESYSEYDAELREFRSFDELSSAFRLGSDPHGNGKAVLLQLWFPSVMREVQFERITLKVAGHSFRYCVSGVGLVQLYLGGESGSVITESHYGHWSEAGARQRANGDVDAVDWSALSRISGRIQRHIRNKLAVARVRGRPVLSAAFSALQSGSGLRYSTLRFHADSPEIELSRGTTAKVEGGSEPGGSVAAAIVASHEPGR